MIRATLERDYGIAADFRETTVVCIERPARVGEAEEVISAPTKTNITGRSSPHSTNPFKATLALRIEPVPFGLGRRVPRRRRAAAVPLYLFKTPDMFLDADAGLRPRSPERGPGRLAGHRLPRDDDRLRLRVAGRRRPADFRRLTQLVLMTALDRAGTWVCEPMADLALEMPASTAPGVLASLGRLGGRVTGQFSANGLSKVGAVLPVARVRSLQNQLPGLSMGEGILEHAVRRLPAHRREPATTPTLRAEPAGA